MFRERVDMGRHKVCLYQPYLSVGPIHQQHIAKSDRAEPSDPVGPPGPASAEIVQYGTGSKHDGDESHSTIPRHIRYQAMAKLCCPEPDLPPQELVCFHHTYIPKAVSMAIKRALAVLALASSLLVSPVLAEEQEKCGQASYYPSEYTCYDDKTLCPIQFSLPTKPCGGGCYSPEQYSCEDGTIKDLPEATSPFTLTFSGVRKTFRNLHVKACGRYLAVGANARECYSCAASGGTNCGSYQNSTVLLPGGQMASDVPGHQFWYVNPTDGILRYTEALASNATTWNATIPGKEFAGQNVKVYENGLFTWTREDATTHWWMACLVTLPGGTVGTGRSWRIYAPTYVNMERGDCEIGRIVAKAVDRKAGAYKYP